MDSEAAAALVAPLLPDWAAAPADVAESLLAYEALLRRWAPVHNLVSRETLTGLWDRHFLDSLQLVSLLAEPPMRALDLGSGAGLPAIPMALAMPTARFTLIEATHRKAAFLRQAGTLPARAPEIIAERIESVDLAGRDAPDLITARALAPLPRLLAACLPAWGAGTRALFPKGRNRREELADAHTGFSFDLVEHESRTAPGSAILEIRHLRSRATG